MENLKEKYSQIIRIDLENKGVRQILFPYLTKEEAIKEYNKLWLINGVEYCATKIDGSTGIHWLTLEIVEE